MTTASAPRHSYWTRPSSGGLHRRRREDRPWDRFEAISPVGTAGLFEIAYAHRSAAFGIAIRERRRGSTRRRPRLVLDFAFHVLQLRNAML